MCSVAMQPMPASPLSTVVDPIPRYPEPSFDPLPRLSDPFLEPFKPVIDVQPQAGKMIPAPPPPYVSYLEELSSLDRLVITKRLNVKNVLYLRGKKNKFAVRTSEQRILYTVEEENNWWVGYVCYGLRPMQLKVMNRQGIEIMRMDRPYACTARMLPCQLQTLRVFVPPGNEIGSVEQQWTILKPKYLVKKLTGEHLFWIYGPYITVSCYSDIKFTITRADGSLVGSTCKRWLGLTHALFFSPITDKFSVDFDMDLPVDEKALLLAATLLLDYMYYDA